ncbi:hypothetical protein KSP40_PGU006847 [Platanthera guangdongensis]|uniref:Josephin-like protein n=1 Tax=Platanthera guangdongensis TaxID=2320717 RepID=A0ABR2LPK7_9ASPA
MVVKKREGERSAPAREASTTCLPKRWPSGRPPTPASFLCRLRRVVFKLIMLSASSKSGAAGNSRKKAVDDESSAAVRSIPSSHQKQAVEDCIEFFKKSSSPAAKAADVCFKSGEV